MDIRNQLANHLLTSANVHPATLWLLNQLLTPHVIDYTNYNDDECRVYIDQLEILARNTPQPYNFDIRAELMQGLINNDKLNPIALKILASIINGNHNENEEFSFWFNEITWQDYLNKIGVDELYEYTNQK